MSLQCITYSFIKGQFLSNYAYMMSEVKPSDWVGKGLGSGLLLLISYIISRQRYNWNAVAKRKTTRTNKQTIHHTNTDVHNYNYLDLDDFYNFYRCIVRVVLLVQRSPPAAQCESDCHVTCRDVTGRRQRADVATAHASGLVAGHVPSGSLVVRGDKRWRL